jgi:hypothetical protein
MILQQLSGSSPLQDEMRIQVFKVQGCGLLRFNGCGAGLVSFVVISAGSNHA